MSNAFVSGFLHDVFISYAHVNNVPRKQGEAGWVDNFAEDLKKSLAQLIGRVENFHIWRDSELRGNNLLTPTIEKELRGSALFINVMSTGYLKSSWCLKEFEVFRERGQATGNLTIGTSSRILPVYPASVAKEELPPELSDSTGYSFFEKDINGNEFPLRRTASDDPDQRYWKAIDTLSRDVIGLLTTMKEVPNPVIVPSNGITVYLAEVTDDLEDYRTEVKTELEQFGYTILPATQLPQDATEIEAVVCQDLQQAVLSIHLAGAPYGRKISGGSCSVARYQYQVASETAKQKNIKQIIWIAPDVEPAKVGSQPQREFLEELLNSSGEVLQRTGIEELKDRIRKALEPAEPTKKKARLPAIYIPYAPEDKELAQQISTFLRQRNYDAPAQENKTLENYRSNLKYFNALLLIYGQSPGQWILERAMEAREALTPIKGSVVEVPPVPKDLALGLGDWKIVDCHKGFKPEALDDFLSSLTN